MEALKAQAVAARTYALWTLGRPPAGAAAVYDFDICASVQCQVFSGADVLGVPGGSRWKEAVAATQGKAALHRGDPILARYHSTSGGITLNNSDAFPTERDYPYLRSVSSTTEESSPLYRWTVDFPLRRLQRMLRRAGWWGPDMGRLAGVRTISSRAGFVYPDVLLRGSKDVVVRTADELRDAVRAVAPRLWPRRYPSAAPTASGRLPETLPSSRIEISSDNGVARVVGRGWGHGVGMSQWGAHGLAARGSDYDDILTHYYTGVSVGEVESSRPIDVGVVWGRDEIVVSGAFRIENGRGRVLVPRALGTWRFKWAGTGSVAIDPPKGFGLPLELGIVTAPRTVGPGVPAEFEIALSRPARVSTSTTGPGRAGELEGVIKQAGVRRVVWRAPQQPGRYEVVVAASTGTDRLAAEPVDIVVARPLARPAPKASPAGRAGAGIPVALGGSAVVLALVAGAFLVRWKREPGDGPRGPGEGGAGVDPARHSARRR